jgi:hypothetical protein
LDRYFVVKEVDDAKDTGVSLEGYPHIHLAVGQYNLTGVIRNPDTYLPMIDPIIQDVQVSSKRKQPGRKIDFDNPVALISYILKNNRHGAVDEKLGDHPEFHTICNLLRCPPDVCKIFKKLNDLNNRIWFINDPTVPLKPDEQKIISTPQPKGNITAKRGSNALEQACSRVKFYMESNNLALHNGRVYERDPESKMTWKITKTKYGAGSTVQILDRVITYDSLFILTHKKRILDSMAGIDQMIFPAIDLDCQWVEFKDCYLCLALGAIVRNNDHYPCMAYYPNITYQDIVNNTVELPKNFIAIVDNSLTDPEEKKNFYIGLFKLYLPRIHKDPVIYLWGEPNSGKTTIIDTITRVLPLDKRGSLADSSFSLSTLSNKYILVVDEGQGILTLPQSLLLKILEGDADIPIDIKHQAPTTIHVNMNIIMASNEDLSVRLEAMYEDDEDDKSIQSLFNKKKQKKDGPISRRLVKFRFRTLPLASAGGKDSVEAEQGEVIIWLARKYHNEFSYYDSSSEIESVYTQWKKKNPR